VCKFFATELQARLDKSAKSKAVIETGHGIDPAKKKRFAYRTSELRLTEALHEPHICENVLEYNVHAERAGSRRYAKGRSETMSTLHGLVNKGVRVELGIPYDLWDKPSAEVSKMHRICFNLAEKYEDDIEEWYYNYQDTEPLLEYICRDRYLKHKNWNDDCLDEKFQGNYEDYRPEHAPSHFKKGEEEDEEEDEDDNDEESMENFPRKTKGDAGDADAEPPVVNHQEL